MPDEKGLIASEADNRLAIFGDDFNYDELAAAIDGNLDSLDLKISRFALQQPLSPMVVSKTLNEGCIADNTTFDCLTVKEKAPWLLDKPGIDKEEIQRFNYLRFCPICILPKEYVKWKDRNTEGPGMHWKSLDKSEPRVREGIYENRGGKWKPSEGNRRPPVTENINILGVVVNELWVPTTMPIISTFARTSFRTGQFMMKLLARHKLYKLPPWGFQYYLYTDLGKPREGKSDHYFVMKTLQGPAMSKLPPIAVENAKALHATCKALALQLTDGTKDETDPTRTKGQVLQESYLSAAQLEDETNDADEGDADDSAIDAGADPSF
jgi:hypothetical protein